MRSSRRPTHLLVGAHPAVQQPLYRTLGGRRRYRLVVSPGGGIIDDQTGLPGDVSLKATKHACHLTRGRSVRRYRFGRSIEYHQGVSDEIERQLYLPVPETPTDMLDPISDNVTHGLGEIRPVVVLRDVAEVRGRQHVRQVP